MKSKNLLQVNYWWSDWMCGSVKQNYYEKEIAIVQWCPLAKGMCSFFVMFFYGLQPNTQEQMKP